MENKLLVAAVKVFHKREKDELDAMFSYFKSFPCSKKEFPKKESRQVWFWGLNRWGREFALKECDIRQLTYDNQSDINKE